MFGNHGNARRHWLDPVDEKKRNEEIAQLRTEVERLRKENVDLREEVDSQEVKT